MAEFSNPRGGFVDTAGNVLAGGSVYFYTTATTTLKDVYSDVNLTTASANPVVLDGSGHPPLRYLDGTYAIIVKDADGVTQPHYTADPIGGNPALFGALGDWNSVVIYSINDTVQGSDGLFYQSLVNSNLANDPTDPSPTNWSEIKFVGVYNASDTYAANEVVMDSSGILWVSIAAANTGNTPSTSPLKWSTAVQNPWGQQAAAFTVVPGKRYSIDASGGSRDGALPTTVVIGDEIIVHNESISTNTVRLTNTALTIKGPGGTVTSSDNLVLAAGDTVHMIAKTTLILEVV